MSGFQDTTAFTMGGVAADSAIGAAVEGRAKIFEMTQAAEDAVLAPAEAGGLSHDLRAALAARIARLNGEADLAERYAGRIGGDAALADPANDGTAQDMGAVVAFMDKVAGRTAEVRAEDVETLKSAGIGDADIVRLAELNAFLAYQIRLIAGLRLMGETQ
ncbi:hypothetical protein [Oceaniglobus trochenteri]|uniref:hypothetical protein n=1 Tax=Oceaniglobus trochenteri TaxID=2763260 RepID=UPI001CFFEBFC|nr:hypothetical protein [Oceaniglobus trochenteri]